MDGDGDNDILTKSVLEAVEVLGPKITHTDQEIRKAALETLTEKLTASRHDQLSSLEVSTLLTFYTQKLEDHHSIIRPVLNGIYQLTAFTEFSSTNAVSLSQSLLTGQTSIQSLPQSDRSVVYKIIARLLDSHLSALQTLSHDFVFSFIQTIDGEKDPRNLVIVFQLAEVVIKSFQIDRFVEDFFEVISCYFPIEFSPPPNDRYGITRDQLVELNLSCLTASPEFAEFCLPLLLEKLTSDLKTARESALLALDRSAAHYRLADLTRFERSFADCLHHELHRGTDQSYIRLVIKCGVSLARAYNDRGTDSERKQFSDVIFTKLGADLLSLDDQLSHKSSLLISGMASVGEKFCRPLITSCISLLSNEFFAEKATVRPAQVIIINELLQRLDMFPSIDVNECTAGLLPRLASFSRQLVTTSGNNLGLELASLTCLARVCLLSFSLGSSSISLEDSRSAFLFILHRCINAGSNRQDLRKTGISLLSETIRMNHWSFLPESIEDFKINIQDPNSEEDIRDFYLEVLEASCQEPKFLTRFLPWMLSLIPSEARLTEPLCETVLRVLSSATQGWDLSTETIVCEAVVKALAVMITKPQLSNTTVEAFIGSLSLLTQLVSSQNQRLLLSTCFKNLQNSTSTLSQDTVPHCHVIFWLCSIICALDHQVSNELAKELLPPLYSWATTTLDSIPDRCANTASKTFASLINKLSDSTNYQDLVTSTITKLSTPSPSEFTPKAGRLASLLVWTCRGLLHQHNSSVCTTLVASLFDMLSSPSACKLVVDKIGLLTTPCVDAFTAGCRSVLSPLYNQKTYFLVCRRLGSLLEDAVASQKGLLLCGYLQLVASMPEEILLENADEIMPHALLPLLVTSQSEAQLLSLKILTCLTSQELSKLFDYVDDIIPTLCQMLSPQNYPLNIRLSACQMLAHLVKLPDHLTAKHRESVLRILRQTTDDNKRVVRTRAVHAANLWCT